MNRTFVAMLAFVLGGLFGLPAVPGVDPVLPALACPASGGGDTDQRNDCPDDPGTTDTTGTKGPTSSGLTPPRIEGPGGKCVVDSVVTVCGEEGCISTVFMICI